MCRIDPVNEVTDDKIREYRDEYNNSPSSSIPFMTAVVSTSGRLHCEFVRILFLQTQTCKKPKDLSVHSGRARNLRT